MVNRNDPVDDDDPASKIKQLELELARVKLELVDAQCRNQEFDHKLKSVLNNTNSISQDSSNEGKYLTLRSIRDKLYRNLKSFKDHRPRPNHCQRHL